MRAKELLKPRGRLSQADSISAFVFLYMFRLLFCFISAALITLKDGTAQCLILWIVQSELKMGA